MPNKSFSDPLSVIILTLDNFIVSKYEPHFWWQPISGRRN